MITEVTNTITRFPLSFAQRSFLLLEQMLPRNTYSTLVNAIQILGHIHHEAMAQAFDEMVAQHAALRTTIVANDNKPQQQINPATRRQLATWNLAANDEQAVADYIINEFETPFDIQAGPLFRATLLNIDAERSVYVLAIHHIVCDGWSLEITNRELFNRYEAICNGTTWRPAINGTTPGEFAQWQQSMLTSDKWSRVSESWIQKFSGSSGISANITPSVAFRVERMNLTLPTTTAKSITGIAQSASCTKMIVFIAALNMLLCSWTGKNKVRLATLVSTRFTEELEWTVGLFLNTLVFVTEVPDSVTFPELLKLTKKEFLDAYGDNSVPFEYLLDSLVSKNNINAASLCRVMFLYHPLTKKSVSIGELTYGRIDLKAAENRPFVPTTFDLILSVQENEQNIDVSVTYKCAFYESKTIECLLEHFHGILQSLEPPAFNAFESASEQFRKSYNRP